MDNLDQPVNQICMSFDCERKPEYAEETQTREARAIGSYGNSVVKTLDIKTLDFGHKFNSQHYQVATVGPSSNP